MEDSFQNPFRTLGVLQEYLVIPFGLINAPAVYQCLVNDVLGDLLNCYIFIYLDDTYFF